MATAWLSWMKAGVDGSRRFNPTEIPGDSLAPLGQGGLGQVSGSVLSLTDHWRCKVPFVSLGADEVQVVRVGRLSGPFGNDHGDPVRLPYLGKAAG